MLSGTRKWWCLLQNAKKSLCEIEQKWKKPERTNERMEKESERERERGWKNDEDDTIGQVIIDRSFDCQISSLSMSLTISLPLFFSLPKKFQREREGEKMKEERGRRRGRNWSSCESRVWSRFQIKVKSRQALYLEMSPDEPKRFVSFFNFSWQEIQVRKREWNQREREREKKIK